MSQGVRVRPMVDEVASRLGGFVPVNTRRGYLYVRPGPSPISQFILFVNHTGGLGVFICSSITGRWSEELGGTAAKSTAQLSYLKNGPCPSDRLLYAHSGTRDSVQKALDAISMDYETYGNPWFHEIEARIKPGHLLYEGLQWLDRYSDRLTPVIWEEIESKLKEVQFKIPRLEHPLFDALKKHLQDSYDHVASSKEERQSMPKLALHLLEYAALANAPLRSVPSRSSS